MKSLLLVLFLPLYLFSQKYALISKSLKQPIIYTDSLTVEQLRGNFAFEVKSYDTLYASLVYLKNMLSERKRSKMQSFDFKSGATTLSIERIPFAYGDRFKIIGTTQSNNIESVFKIGNGINNNKATLDRLNKLIAYLKRNNEIFTEPYQIHPKMYNVVVVTE
jgi:hypothetical protein